MAKLADDTVLDAALSIVNNATMLTVCKSEPTTYAQAATSYKLASVVISASDFSAITNGSPNGREITVKAQNSVSVDTTGKAARICLLITGSSKLLYKTECSSQSISASNKVNVGSWTIRIADPT
jgi:hypothetical protein